jgi:hypothetical protein
MFISGVFITVDYMNAMKELNKTSIDLSFDILKEWANSKRPLIVRDNIIKPLIDTGFFVTNDDIQTSTGFRAIMPDEYGEASSPVQLTIDTATLEKYIPGLSAIFTNTTGISEKMSGGKRNHGMYNVFWRKPIIEMINHAPATNMKDKANLVAKAMPIAIEKQKAQGYSINTPLSIVKFVQTVLDDGSDTILEIR